MMASGDAPNNYPSNSWRRALKTSVAALLTEIGYQSSEVLALESMVEMVQGFITELGRYSSGLAELSGRTQVMPSDVVLAIIESGIDIRGIPTHARRDNKIVLQTPAQAPSTPLARILQVGDKRKHPAHIPDHFPPFPDPHTYIKTPSYRQPANEYQLVRERVSSQKRDVEVGLTRFIAKTGETHALFKDDKSAFPLIACKPTSLPYLSALLPKDSEAKEQEGIESEAKTLPPKQPADAVTLRKGAENGDQSTDQDTIDNPYLCPVKMAKKSQR